MFQVAENTCDVVVVTLKPHPNADTLSLVMVGDFQCAVRTADWNDGDLAVYIPPDSLVPDTKEFEFLGKHRRIKAKKLRGEWSVGLLIPAPDGAILGDDLMEKLGIEHYEPEVHGTFTTGGENVASPKGFYPKYDVMNFRKYSRLFEEGEEVVITEKIHGANAKFVCVDDIVYCGSRNNWKKEDPNNLWWKAYLHNPVLEAWLRHHQNLTIYGEVFGQVQNLKYGAVSTSPIFFSAFDILDGDQWIDFDKTDKLSCGLPWVPLVYRGPFDKEKILEFAEGDSLWPGANNVREGVVVKPVHERTDPRLGRVQLKVVGNGYLSKS